MRIPLAVSMMLSPWGCWAPEQLHIQEEVLRDPGIPSPSDPQVQGAPANALTMSLNSTPPSQFPEPPFTAWTVDAPLSIQQAGTATEPTTLKKRGIRIEVLQVLEPRHQKMRIRCDGCVDGEIEGWLQIDKGIRVKGSHGSSTDPLASILSIRASRWASEADLPEGVHRNDLCGLVDHGFVLEGNSAVWAHAGGRIEMRFEEEQWQLHTLVPPAPGQKGSCRTTG